MANCESDSGVLSKSVNRAVGILRRGGVVAAPTDTLYGILANALDERAARKVFAVKMRTAGSPLPIFVSEAADLAKYGRDVPEIAYALADAFWPGKLTIIVPKSDLIPEAVSGGLDTVGMRVPNHAVPREIVAALGAPATATSANLSGTAPLTSAGDVARELGARVDMVLDGGELAPSAASTVIDATATPLKILRVGAVAPQTIERMTGAAVEV